jgi:hypothetical protein
MTSTYRIPHVEVVAVPRPHVMRLSFDDGTVRELQFLVGGNEGTSFASLDDPAFFAQVTVDPTSRTVVWPHGLDLDPAVLHGDFEPVGRPHFRNLTQADEQRPARSG